jgi:hypothetical protein
LTLLHARACYPVDLCVEHIMDLRECLVGVRAAISSPTSASFLRASRLGRMIG